MTVIGQPVEPCDPSLQPRMLGERAPQSAGTEPGAIEIRELRQSAGEVLWSDSSGGDIVNRLFTMYSEDPLNEYQGDEERKRRDRTDHSCAGARRTDSGARDCREPVHTATQDISQAGQDPDLGGICCSLAPTRIGADVPDPPCRRLERNLRFSVTNTRSRLVSGDRGVWLRGSPDVRISRLFISGLPEESSMVRSGPVSLPLPHHSCCSTAAGKALTR